jgi:hypothetical protein
MKKAVAEGRAPKTLLNPGSLAALEAKGYRFVLVKGLTIDNHYEHVEPHYVALIPVKELPRDPAKKDVYAPIKSEILKEWAREKNEGTEFVILGK